MVLNNKKLRECYKSNIPFLTYFFPFNLVKKYTKYDPTAIKVQPAIEYSEFKNPNFIAIKANKFIAITQQTNINISLKKAFIFSFITKLQNIIEVLQQY